MEIVLLAWEICDDLGEGGNFRLGLNSLEQLGFAPLAFGIYSRYLGYTETETKRCLCGIYKAVYRTSTICTGAAS
jgi:hypothetical protein